MFNATDPCAQADVVFLDAEGAGQYLTADAARAQNDQLVYIEISKREGEFAIQVRRTPSWPRSWANFSLR